MTDAARTRRIDRFYDQEFDAAGPQGSIARMRIQAVPHRVRGRAARWCPAVGLEGDLLRRCYLQYASTLRNPGEYRKSPEVFEQARAVFPDSPAPGVFEAITLQAAGRPNDSIASLPEIAAQSIDTVTSNRCACCRRDRTASGVLGDRVRAFHGDFSGGTHHRPVRGSGRGGDVGGDYWRRSSNY